MVSIISDVGNKRTLNEDYASYLETEEYKIYVVTDGMGGHNAGEVASKMAAEGIVDFIKEKFSIYTRKEEILKDAISKVNMEIFKFSELDEKLSGMGTTVTAVLKTSSDIFVGNVGDSSCLGIKDEEIVKITKDHSLVQELLDLGTISEEEAINHPKKNIITRAVGTSEELLVDIFKINKNEFDMFLLCSDGLTNEVSKEEILRIIYNSESIDKACNRLIESAKDNGGRDNITILLCGGDEIKW